MEKIEEVIRNTTEKNQSKVDWTKAWSTKYPVLKEYQQVVDIPKYAKAIRGLFDELQKTYAGYLNSTRENTVTYTKSTQRPVKSFSADGISPYQEQRKSRLTTPAVRTPKR